jgi:hypothetical protein
VETGQRGVVDVRSVARASHFFQRKWTKSFDGSKDESEFSGDIGLAVLTEEFGRGLSAVSSLPIFIGLLY